MVELAGFTSNRGRNLFNLDDLQPASASLAVLVTDDPDAHALDAANARNIPTVVVSEGEDESAQVHEGRVLQALSAHSIDLVCLDRYSRSLSGATLDELPLALDVHPSLLPAFPGPRAPEAAIDAGVSVTGCTVHVVTDADDHGPIVTQEPVPVTPEDTVARVTERIRDDAEFKAYPRAVRWVVEGRLAVADDRRSVSVEPIADPLAERDFVSADRQRSLRYGENPHQAAALYVDPTRDTASVAGARQRNPEAKAVSYNNVNDADAAFRAAAEFDRTACAVIKHANPAGVATANAQATAYERALSTDAMSAFGGIVGLNEPCTRETAIAITDSFKETVVAPGFEAAALEELRSRETLRVLEVPIVDRSMSLARRSVLGGHLVQERDTATVTAADLEVVTDRAPTEAERRTMSFAWRVAKHVASNAIVLATGTETVGIGQGQVSRVDAATIAVRKAGEHAEGKGAAGSVLASDGFFPFPDAVDVAAAAGVEAIVQPGGSRNDDEVIDAANDHDLPMAFTGRRCFRH